MNRPVWTVLCSLAFGTSAAMAQGNPVFTAKTVHPYDAPVLGVVRDAEAPPPPPPQRPIPRGHNPRAHAVEVAEVFKQACLQGRGQTAAASDWALSHGFSPLSEDAVKEMAQGMGGTGEAIQMVNVFVRRADTTDTVMLLLGDNPLACSVGTRQNIDGARLRDRMAQLVAGWVGQAKPPAPAVSLDNPQAGTRMVGYKVTSGRWIDSLVVTAPVGVGRGLALLALMIDDAPPAR